MALTSHQWGSADPSFVFQYMSPYTCDISNSILAVFTAALFYSSNRNLAEERRCGDERLGGAQIEKCNIIRAGILIPTSLRE